jgi:hypothetical protein
MCRRLFGMLAGGMGSGLIVTQERLGIIRRVRRVRRLGEQIGYMRARLTVW